MNKDLSTCQEETYGKLKQMAHASGLSFVVQESVVCASVSRPLCDYLQVWYVWLRFKVYVWEVLRLLKPNYLGPIHAEKWIIVI